MARVLKWLLIAVATLAALLGIAIVAILMLVDPNDYKGEIAAAVERETGRKLVIEGDIDLTFFPWLGLELGRSHLEDAPGYGSEPFLALERAKLAVQLVPLLQRRLVLDTIVLDGVRLNLIRNRLGRANWEELMDRVQQSQASKPETPPAGEPGKAGPPVTLESLGGLELKQAAVVYEDRDKNVRYVLDPLNLEVAGLDPAKPIPVKGDFGVTGTDLPKLTGTLSAQVSFNPKARTFAIPDLALDLKAQGEQVPSGALEASLRTVVEGNLDEKRYTLSQLALQAAGVSLQGNVQAVLQEAGPLVTAQLSVPAFSPRELMGRLKIEPPKTADPKVLNALALQTAVKYSPEGLQLNDLRLRLDDTNASGEATIRAFSPITAGFKLAVDQINLDRYLAPKAETPAGGGQAPAPRAPGGAEQGGDLPVEMLRKLNLDGVVNVGQLVFQNMKISELKAELRARDGDIRLDPVTGQLYDGRYAGVLALNARGEQPKLTMDQKLTGVQAGPLLQDLIGQDRLTGSATVALNGTMTGARTADWIKTLTGAANFQFTDGALKGVNIAQSIRQAQAMLAAEPPPANEPPQTDFSALGGSLTITNGVAQNKDFRMQSPLMRVTGEGEFNIAELAVDYLLTVNLVNTLTGQGGKSMADLTKVPIPLRISGPVSDLKIKVDLMEAIRQSQGARIQAEEDKLKARVQEEREKAEKQAEEAVRKGLQDLLRKR